MPDSAIDALSTLIAQKLSPQGLDSRYDTLKLMGMVIGQMTLLKIATDVDLEPAARVSAARALITIKESPESIAERIRRSPFSDLSVEQLQSIVIAIGEGGDTDLAALIDRVKRGPDSNAS